MLYMSYGSACRTPFIIASNIWSSIENRAEKEENYWRRKIFTLRRKREENNWMRKMFGMREGKVNRGEKKFTKKDIFRPKKANDINVGLLP